MASSVSAPVVIVMTILIVVYVAVGTLYAGLTPAWQVPDEPAHYNYIRSLAEGRGFPILEQGDYNQAYQERLTSERFPPELSIEPLTYEDHQPPLYYLLATPIYLVFDGALLPLRLLSVVLGAGLLIAAFGTVRTVFPKRPSIGLMVAAFIAFIPQHVAMTAGVNNDTLAELTVAGTLWALVIYLGGANDRPWAAGLLVGTALLTKTTAYVVAGVAVGAVLMRGYHEKQTWQWAGKQLAWILIPTLILSAPWFVRNGLTYGWSDPLGLARHDVVVAGQPRSSEWLADYGWAGLLTRMARTTFQSFWGQFGWMAVPLPAAIYRGLLFLSLLLTAAFLARLVWRGLKSSPRPMVVYRCLLLSLSAALTFSAFLWYNLTFVQHQGRYLFPALIPLGTAGAWGLCTLASPLPRQLRSWTLGLFFAGLAAFDVYCLFNVALPNL